jgi:hypothetical protein
MCRAASFLSKSSLDVLGVHMQSSRVNHPPYPLLSNIKIPLKIILMGRTRVDILRARLRSETEVQHGWHAWITRNECLCACVVLYCEVKFMFMLFISAASES